MNGHEKVLVQLLEAAAEVDVKNYVRQTPQLGRGPTWQGGAHLGMAAHCHVSIEGDVHNLHVTQGQGECLEYSSQQTRDYLHVMGDRE
jgi:hypothetical protein